MTLLLVSRQALSRRIVSIQVVWRCESGADLFTRNPIAVEQCARIGFRPAATGQIALDRSMSVRMSTLKGQTCLQVWSQEVLFRYIQLSICLSGLYGVSTTVKRLIDP